MRLDGYRGARSSEMIMILSDKSPRCFKIANRFQSPTEPFGVEVVFYVVVGAVIIVLLALLV